MKALLIALVTLASVSGFAANQAALETRHYDLIVKNINEVCGSFRGLQVVNVEKETIRVDQGIIDANYVTTLVGEQRMDQNIFDEYTITVYSSYSDSYDHSAKDWGSYSVDSVRCVMK